MKNVTISMDEELAKLTRIEAAKAGLSISKFISRMIEEQLRSGENAAARRQRKIEAMERFLAGPKWSVMENGLMPTSEERNARR